MHDNCEWQNTPIPFTEIKSIFNLPETIFNVSAMFALG